MLVREPAGPRRCFIVLAGKIPLSPVRPRQRARRARVTLRFFDIIHSGRGTDRCELKFLAPVWYRTSDLLAKRTGYVRRA